MSQVELNCKWFFPDFPQNGSLVGANEPMSENFKKTPYASLVREAIQNSLDERLDKSKPLVMSFSIKRMNINNYQDFFEIKKHLEGCIEFYKDKADVYQPMVDYINNNCGPGKKIPYIQVSDYNANGMPYNVNNPNDPQSPFVAFVRAAGISTKSSQNAGGSFGFGKAAYFYLSPIRTILVSTYTKDHEFFFEGVSSLCTHKYNGVNKMHIGYYDSNGGQPITESEKIPGRFRRKSDDDTPIQPGTDIFIMGLKSEDDLTFEYSQARIYREMLEAVLRNFWMAIYDEMLVVNVGESQITKENLNDIMEQTFEEEDDSSRSINDYNPRPYLRMVIEADNASSTKSKKISMDLNGNPANKIILYLQKNKNANDRVLYMRSPRMLVKQEKKRNRRGFYGTFICTGSILDARLRQIENPAHTEWDKRNFDGDKSTARKIEKDLDDIFEFVRNEIDKLFASSDSSEDTIKDLEQYLFIPTDTDEDEDDFVNQSLTSNATDELQDDGSSITTDSEEVPMPNVSEESHSQSGVVLQPHVSSTNPSSNGGLLSGNGNGHRTNTGGGRSTRHINQHESEGDADDSNRTTLTAVPVRYRSFAQTENGKTIHNIIIHSDYDIENGRIDLRIGTEDNDEPLIVKWTNLGVAQDNTVTELPIKKGTNRIKVSFSDSMKHSVLLDAYEVK